MKNRRFWGLLLLSFFVTLQFAKAESVRKQLEKLLVAGSLDKPKTTFVCMSDEIPAIFWPSPDEPYIFLIYLPRVEISGTNIIKTKGNFLSYLRKGELLLLSKRKIGDDYIELTLLSISRYTIGIGVGDVIRLFTRVRFHFDRDLLKGTDAGPILEQIEHRFRRFVEIGTTVAEVERMFGEPDKKFTFPDKTVYRYKDFTVELEEGVVTDIKY